MILRMVERMLNKFNVISELLVTDETLSLFALLDIYFFNILNDIMLDLVLSFMIFFQKLGLHLLVFFLLYLLAFMIFLHSMFEAKLPITFFADNAVYIIYFGIAFPSILAYFFLQWNGFTIF